MFKTSRSTTYALFWIKVFRYGTQMIDAGYRENIVNFPMTVSLEESVATFTPK